jgi:ribosomal protein L35
MPKMKTPKALSKKVRITKSGKAMRRFTKQNHYNSKQTGDFKRRKRRDVRLFKADEKNVIKALQV